MLLRCGAYARSFRRGPAPVPGPRATSPGGARKPCPTPTARAAGNPRTERSFASMSRLPRRPLTKPEWKEPGGKSSDQGPELTPVRLACGGPSRDVVRPSERPGSRSGHYDLDFVVRRNGGLPVEGDQQPFAGLRELMSHRAAIDGDLHRIGELVFAERQGESAQPQFAPFDSDGGFNGGGLLFLGERPPALGGRASRARRRRKRRPRASPAPRRP